MLSPQHIPVEPRRQDASASRSFGASSSEASYRNPELSQSTPASLKSMLDSYQQITEPDVDNMWSVAPPSPPSSTDDESLERAQERADHEHYLSSLDLATTTGTSSGASYNNPRSPDRSEL